MDNIYTSGEYLDATKTWHAEDAPWKADLIQKIIDRNRIRPLSVIEIGCGSGAILMELSRLNDLQEVYFEGYDISPQAIDLARKVNSKKIQFMQKDILAEDDGRYFDLLLAIDVFEHVPDYMDFIKKCKGKALYKVFHIPLDLHVSSVLRNSFLRTRYTIGHIHYFTAESAICALKDAGHEIMDSFYTDGAIGVFREHPTMKKAAANVPRWLLSKASLSLTARLLGGYSLLVLTK